MPFQPAAHDGVAHCFSPGLLAFEHRPANASAATNTNVLIWVGGLGDGLLTVPYPTAIASKLPPNWILAQPLLSSSYAGWGTSSLVRDADELAQCVKYFRERRGPGAKIVVMGHSTGCQDAIEYVSSPSDPSAAASRTPLDAVILQAPASDRQAMLQSLGKASFDAANDVARQYVEDGRGEDVLPFRVTEKDFKKTPISARRWLALASPDKKGADDFFSDDLPDESLKKTFGAVPKGLGVCVLYSGSDEFCPSSVDKGGLVRRWSGFVKEAGGVWEEEFGGVVPGATHNLKGSSETVVSDLCRRVVGFLQKVEKGEAAHL
ncbi:uncharacterized protein BKCO1_2400011 [Diplodia corticola]|uniref:Siderophore biosynthesis lipase esterase n=1 Tax=Diplodia corticola TaxID=236234 RepID=A0A1J9QYS8_9PEZI|nr:uncharacterized protein BKCO1_2400011 [Diplodia corticola]OJD34222.1 hypothetical protein BKCO1_2400011 [Diplodia corticola]